MRLLAVRMALDTELSRSYKPVSLQHSRTTVECDPGGIDSRLDSRMSLLVMW